MKNDLQKKIISCLLIITMIIGYIVPSFNAVYALTSNELPAGFTSVAIGNNDGTGSATFDKINKVLNIKGSGQYIGKDLGKTDSYQFVNYKVEGDATIIARLLDFDISQAAKGQAGVFIREDNNTDNANYYGVYVDPTKDAYRCAYRDNSAGRSGATSIQGLTSSSKNQYIKIVKKGSKFSYSISSDATFPEENTITKTKTVSSNSNTWYAGFVVSNGGSANSAVADFDNIIIEDSTGELFNSNSQIDDETPELPETPETPELPEIPELPDYNQGILPNGFTNLSIGNNSENVLANFDKDKKQFTVNGSGTYIGKDAGATDNYQFVNYKVEGNATIVARLVDFDMSQANYGQAGVFVREDNNTNNADYFGVYVEPSKNEYRYAFRDKANERVGAATISGLTKDSKNQYIKIVREKTDTGSQFRYYISEDKTFPEDKTLTNSQTVLSTNDTWYVGFVVSNGGSETPAVATFDNVIIENESKVYYNSEEEVKVNPIDTVENLKAEGSDSKVTLTWNAVENATSYIINRATSKNGEYTAIAEIDAPETTYVDNDVVNFDTYYYKVAAKNENGVGNDSQVAMAIPNNSNSSNIQYEDNAAIFNMTKEPNDTVSNSVISLEGSTNKDGYISIIQNGELKVKDLAKKADELFEKNLTLDLGRNTIEIYHTTEDGKNSVKSYNIVYLENTNYDIIVDCNYTGVDGEIVDGISTYKTIASAINSVPKNNKDRINIYIKNGTYKEKLTIEKPYVSLIGEDSKKTILTYDAANGTINPATGKTYGTSGSASITVKSKSVGFTAENLTIENAFKETGANNEQAVALNNQADQSIFVNCRFIGNQDTLLADASSSSPARQYYYKCYIEGDVDFIFGRAQAVFNDCDIASFNRKSTSNNGYVTAADTWDSDAYGYLIMNSRLISLDNIAANTVSLGRPWRPSSQTRKMTPAVTYVNCYMGDHITSKGWDDMGVDSLASTSRFYEYGSYGPGAKLSETRNVLSNNQAMNYTISRAFAKNSATTVDGNDAYAYDWMPTDESANVNINSWYKNHDKVEKLELNANELLMNVGDSFKLTATVSTTNNENNSIPVVIFESSDNSVATVDENGNVKALKVGSTVITARCGNKQATCTVTVTYKQAQINRVPVISAEDVVITVGKDFNPMLNVTAKDHEDGDLTNKVEVIENTVDTTTNGIYKVVYKVTDSQGASVTKEIKVTVNPKFTLINRVPVINAVDRVINIDEDFNPMLNVTANDHEDGDLTDKVEVIENTVDTTTIGIYKVVYKVTDSRGASVTKEIKVTVKEIVTDEPVENPGDDTNKPGVGTDNSTNTNKPGVNTNNSTNTNKPGVGTDNSANINKPGVGTDNSANINKPGVGTDNSVNINEPVVDTNNSTNTNKPDVDTDNSTNTNKPGVNTDNSENTNEQDVYNDDNISDSSSPKKGDTGIFGMITLIVVAVAVVIYVINRKKSK
ncbi:pectinesterase family protein [Romboutsia ilealis]|uniref:pectinesterase family protein n=1 Tax=Romboutsia ilealis TaxID=1115758 RepID=UPI0025B764AB|nr:pectinesterase family protein [Romboutsia ilealis]